MKATLKILQNVIVNRMNSGERFDEILIDYPKLSSREIDELKQKLDIEQE